MTADERMMPDDTLAAARELLDKRHFKAALRLLAPEAPADQGHDGHDGREHDLLSATALLGRRRNDLAVRHLRRLLARAPGDAEALFQTGRACHQTNEVPAAVRWFERLWRVAPDFPGARAALAQAYRRDARYEDAIRLVEEAGGTGDVDLLYETAISHSYRGDAAASLAGYEALLRIDPEHAAAWFGSHAPALETHGIGEAMRRLRRAVACPGANGRYWASLCVYHRLLGDEAEARAIQDAMIADNPKRLPLVESVSAVLPHRTAETRLFGMSAALLRHAIDEATLPGLVLEFGVRRGTSINHIAERAGQTVHGFDSFEGLPEVWVNGPRGLLSTGRQLPPVRSNTVLHAGWFEDTLGPFLDAQEGAVRFVNIDSDIYSSARTVLTALAPRIRPGTVLVFDEYIGNRSWREDEHKAFQEFVFDHGVAYDCIALSPFTKQVAFRVTAVGRPSGGRTAAGAVEEGTASERTG